MSDSIDNFVSTVRAVGTAAGKVANDAVEASRNKIQELKLLGELRETYERLGSVVYDSVKKDLENPELVEMIVAEIDGIKKKLEELKTEPSDKKAEQSCPQCGHCNAADSYFCCKCGAPLAVRQENVPAEK